MTMHKALQPIDDRGRLFEPKKEEGRELTSMRDCVDALIRRIEDYIKKSKETVITVTRNNTGKIMINNDEEREMGRKTTVWVFQVINWRNLTRENLDMTKKGKWQWKTTPKRPIRLKQK